MIEVNITGPKLEDFEGIYMLLKQLWPREKLIKRKLKLVFSKGLRNPQQAFLIAKYKGKIIGFVSLSIKNSLYDGGNLGHVDELIIDKKYKRKGTGKELLEEIIKVAKEKSCNRIELDSSFHRKDAHAFYESLGFEKCNFLFSKLI